MQTQFYIFRQNYSVNTYISTKLYKNIFYCTFINFRYLYKTIEYPW